MNDLAFLGSSVMNAVLPVALVVGLMIVLNLLKDKFSRESHLKITDKKHTWRPVNGDNESHRCTICDALLINNTGVYCDSCGITVDYNCIHKVSSFFKCKEIAFDDGPVKHRWLKGNLVDGSCCYVCSEECVEDDVRCIWCQRTLHCLKCLNFLGEVCDFGKLRGVILPPSHVKLKRKKRSFQLQSITDPGYFGWTPLFVIGNPSSGSRVGELILSGFRFLLNPLQVCELNGKTLDCLAFLLSLLPASSKPIVLVAGGDGSIAAVLSALYSKKHKIVCAFRVGIVPLGTGNDLARVLSWGKEEPSPFSALETMDKLLKATTVTADRWLVRLRKGGRIALGQRFEQNYMYNYLSIGVDARVTLDFHRARSSFNLGSRLINKALYLAFGTQQVMEKNCTGLEKELELELDGIRVALPELEAVVVLNIPSWGAGCLLWQLKDPDEEIKEQSMSDGLLEVVGIYSSFHMAQLQVGLSTPYRIGQASTVKILLRKKLPMQIDGEPWIQPPCQVEICAGGQVSLLRAEPAKAEQNSIE